ncbi:Butyrophilin-like protein 2 [Myotis brandtii]|uniref:Butyrophilin-like protein 2 n=1 Tax=Myotis brandtii TaxID=109478 RepID=S7PLV3_MYOBR|nr:Butyrophilin-like protein 2 [Myotis brandtii]
MPEPTPGAFQVQGPQEPVVAMLGGEAELPCILTPRQNIKYMKISWTQYLPSQVVHLYEDGKDKPEKVMGEYLGRTQLVKNAMHKGIMTLKILNVQPSDNRQYRCVIQYGSFYSEAVIELKVAALGSHPQLLVEVTKSSQLRLECKSEGWFPQPKVQWMDSEAGEIPAESETHTQDKGGLFHVTTALLLRETSQKNLTCSFWNSVLNQKKEQQFSTAALGSHPQFHVEVTKSRQLQLECKSEGWFPQPKVQWMDSEETEIPAESETHTQDKGGLFHVTTALLLREASQKKLTCSIWNPVLNQKKEEQLFTTGAFQVHGPQEPVVATLGSETELPCSLLPTQNVKNMKISWTRSLPSQVVHLYEDGSDKPEEAMEEYLGRTELVKNFMDKGIVLLRILSVQPSDNGQYRCAFQDGSFYSGAVIELKVAALGSHPQFHVEVFESRQTQVVCKSEGWFPQPKVQWMDSEGGEIPAEFETHTQDNGGLFHVTTSLLLKEASRKNLTCSIWNPVLNQKKEEQLSIAGQFSLSTHCAPKSGFDAHSPWRW